MIKIKIGDLVKLNGGGSHMTVQLIENGDVKCAWFEHDKLQTANFPISSLIISNQGNDDENDAPQK